MRAFPEDGQWLGLDGQPMTPAMWENPASDGFRFAPADRAAQMAFTVDHAAREVRLGDAA
jgi:hypothetical protein